MKALGTLKDIISKVDCGRTSLSHGTPFASFRRLFSPVAALNPCCPWVADSDSSSWPCSLATVSENSLGLRGETSKTLTFQAQQRPQWTGQELAKDVERLHYTNLSPVRELRLSVRWEGEAEATALVNTLFRQFHYLRSLTLLGEGCDPSFRLSRLFLDHFFTQRRPGVRRLLIATEDVLHQQNGLPLPDYPDVEVEQSVVRKGRGRRVRQIQRLDDAQVELEAPLYCPKPIGGTRLQQL